MFTLEYGFSSLSQNSGWEELFTQSDLPQSPSGRYLLAIGYAIVSNIKSHLSPEAEMSYFVLCEIVEPGLTSGEVTAGVRNFQSRLEFVRAPEDGVIDEKGRKYLGVGVVRYDEKSGAYLVSFPSEADSGTSRTWVPGSSVIERVVPQGVA